MHFHCSACISTWGTVFNNTHCLWLFSILGIPPVMCNSLINQFGVTIWACADKGHSYQDCEIAIDLKYWVSHASLVTIIHVCTSCILECAWEGTLFKNRYIYLEIQMHTLFTRLFYFSFYFNTVYNLYQPLIIFQGIPISWYSELHFYRDVRFKFTGIFKNNEDENEYKISLPVVW